MNNSKKNPTDGRLIGKARKPGAKSEHKKLLSVDDVAGMFVAPKELATRWQCSRSSVDRIAERAGLSRVFLGEGRNGMVRFRRDEVETFEASRTEEGRLRCRT